MAKITNYNFKYDLSPVILWQYSDAEKLKAIVEKQQDFLDKYITQWCSDYNSSILNISTADSYGLSVWGQLLQVARPSYINEQGATVEFTDDEYRVLLRAKIYLLTFDGSARALNEYFKILFPHLIVQVIDNQDMTASIIINEDSMTDADKILFSSNFINLTMPRPSGVQYVSNTQKVDYTRIFGFEGMVDKKGNSVAGFGPDSGTFDPATSPGGTFYE